MNEFLIRNNKKTFWPLQNNDIVLWCFAHARLYIRLSQNLFFFFESENRLFYTALCAIIFYLYLGQGVQVTFYFSFYSLSQPDADTSLWHVSVYFVN